MPDMEKAIKELEEVIAEAVYPDRPRKFMMPLELAEDALALLKAQAPMADLISRAALLNDLSYCAPELWQDEEYVKAKIMKQHVVDAAPVVHGRWIDENPDDSLDPRMRCSICTGVESPLIKWRYCPNCGAKMDGEQRLAFADQSGAEYADNPTV